MYTSIYKWLRKRKARWNTAKNARLKRERGASFEDILAAELVVVLEHEGREGQVLALYEYKKQVWLVPLVEETEGVFLKTAYPSRKYTRRYLKGSGK